MLVFVSFGQSPRRYHLPSSGVQVFSGFPEFIRRLHGGSQTVRRRTTSTSAFLNLRTIAATRGSHVSPAPSATSSPLSLRRLLSHSPALGSPGACSPLPL